uniref:Filamin/ABP280 repeat protein n=1 Tax=Angiostrongylus costaricensis TaxID=334426 RepID=A0A0R3PYT2_ANGCS
LPVGAPYLLHSVPEGNKAEAEYVVSRSDPPRADLVTVTGPGLGPVVVQQSTYVSIDTTFAGFGDIDLFVDGPTRTPVHCVDNRDGTLTVYYVPQTPGVYFLRVMFDNSHISGSPFQVLAVPTIVTSSLMADHDKTDFSFSSMSSGSPTSQTTPCVQ